MSNIIKIVWVLVLLLVAVTPTTASLIEWDDGGDYTVRAQENWAQPVAVGFTYVGQEPRMIAAEWDYNVSYMGGLWLRCTYMDKNDEYYSTNVVHFSVDYNGTPTYNTIRVFDSDTNRTLGRARVTIREGKAKRDYDLHIMGKPVQFHELAFVLIDDSLYVPCDVVEDVKYAENNGPFVSLGQCNPCHTYPTKVGVAKVVFYLKGGDVYSEEIFITKLPYPRRYIR